MVDFFLMFSFIPEDILVFWLLQDPKASFLGTNQRRKIEGHLWVTSIQFAGPSWKPRPLNMKIHSLSQTWLYPVSQIRLTIVIATLIGGCALDHIIFRVFLTEKVLLKICVINASTIISNWTDMKGGHFIAPDKLIAQLLKAYSVLAELIHYCLVSLVTITCCWKSVQNLSNWNTAPVILWHGYKRRGKSCLVHN